MARKKSNANDFGNEQDGTQQASHPDPNAKRPLASAVTDAIAAVAYRMTPSDQLLATSMHHAVRTGATSAGRIAGFNRWATSSEMTATLNKHMERMSGRSNALLAAKLGAFEAHHAASAASMVAAQFNNNVGSAGLGRLNAFIEAQSRQCASTSMYARHLEYSLSGAIADQTQRSVEIAAWSQRAVFPTPRLEVPKVASAQSAAPTNVSLTFEEGWTLLEKEEVVNRMHSKPESAPIPDCGCNPLDLWVGKTEKKLASGRVLLGVLVVCNSCSQMVEHVRWKALLDSERGLRRVPDSTDEDPPAP